MGRGRGRPPVGPVVKVRLDPELIERIDQLVVKYDISSRAQMARILIFLGIDHLAED